MVIWGEVCFATSSQLYLPRRDLMFLGLCELHVRLCHVLLRTRNVNLNVFYQLSLCCHHRSDVHHQLVQLVDTLKYNNKQERLHINLTKMTDYLSITFSSLRMSLYFSFASETAFCSYVLAELNIFCWKIWFAIWLVVGMEGNGWFVIQVSRTKEGTYVWVVCDHLDLILCHLRSEVFDLSSCLAAQSLSVLLLRFLRVEKHLSWCQWKWVVDVLLQMRIALSLEGEYEVIADMWDCYIFINLGLFNVCVQLIEKLL